MYVDRTVQAEAERLWGRPRETSFRVETSDAELAFIRRTQKRGRAHDVTLLIREADGEGPETVRPVRWAAIAKHDYPAGAFRPPSGGLEPGETMEAGAIREAREETGLDVAIERYLLRARVTFAARADGREATIEWTTHVLEGRATGGRLRPLDTHEIREATWLDRDALLGPVRERLLRKRAAGIRYRVALHDAIFAARDGRAIPGGAA